MNNPLDPEEKIRGGIGHLKALKDTFAYLYLTLAAYNAGRGRVIENGIQIINDEDDTGHLKVPAPEAPMKDMIILKHGEDKITFLWFTHPKFRMNTRLHCRRRQIQLFFRCIKHNLRIRRFFGTLENAVKMQIYIVVFFIFASPS